VNILVSYNQATVLILVAAILVTLVDINISWVEIDYYTIRWYISLIPLKDYTIQGKERIQH
jgi:hypothetical protein